MYSKLEKINNVIKNQILIIEYMEEVIKYDEEYTRENINEELPPIENIGVLKSHFTTQKKACLGMISILNRHLPRLEKEKKIDKEINKSIIIKPKECIEQEKDAISLF